MSIQEIDFGSVLKASAIFVSSINGQTPNGGGGGSVISTFQTLQTSSFTVSSINGQQFNGGGSAVSTFSTLTVSSIMSNFAYSNADMWGQTQMYPGSQLTFQSLGSGSYGSLTGGPNPTLTLDGDSSEVSVKNVNVDSLGTKLATAIQVNANIDMASGQINFPSGSTSLQNNDMVANQLTIYHQGAISSFTAEEVLVSSIYCQTTLGVSSINCDGITPGKINDNSYFLTKTMISLDTQAQTIAGGDSANVLQTNFSVVADHYYRITLSCISISGAAAVGEKLVFELAGGGAPQVVIGDAQVGGTISLSCVFRAANDAASVYVQAYNPTSTQYTFSPPPAGVWTLEDLGISLS